ncbi:MAG: GAF domain-containing sensor histidine kinase [Chloroflexota bacterium]|nr:GAF domain-containing sensor histidine kinase [Chloroflexota bacterium]
MEQTLKPQSTTEELQRRNRELSVLNEIAQALNREVDLQQSLQTALSMVAKLLDLETGWLFLMREGTNRAYLAASQDLPPGLANKPRRMTGSCYCLRTYRKGDMDGAANVNVVTCSRLEDLVDGTNGLAYHASIPLYARGKKLGVLNVASRDWRGLSPEDLRLLYTVGDLVSIAIERARLFERSAQTGVVEERNRLAREIHDTLAQGLSAIALQLETADALLESGAAPDRAQQAIKHALALTHSNLEEARRSVLDLRSALLEERTLADALLALAEERKRGHERNEQAEPRRGHPQVKVAIKGGSKTLPLRVEAGLYRVAQEALNNVIRHANAKQATIQLVTLRDEVRLIVEDDGKGFDTSLVYRSNGHYGLIGINERVKLLGGTMRLESSPGTGTRLEVTVPLEGK